MLCGNGCEVIKLEPRWRSKKEPRHASWQLKGKHKFNGGGFVSDLDSARGVIVRNPSVPVRISCDDVFGSPGFIWRAVMGRGDLSA